MGAHADNYKPMHSVGNYSPWQVTYIFERFSRSFWQEKIKQPMVTDQLNQIAGPSGAEFYAEFRLPIVEYQGFEAVFGKLLEVYNLFS